MFSGGMKNTVENWDIEPTYTFIRGLGRGSYGLVCEALHNPTKTRVAIKKEIELFDDVVNCKRILREICLLRLLNSSNVVSLLDIIPPKDPEDFNEINIVLEYAKCDIDKLIKSQLHIQEKRLKMLTYSMILSVKYLHACRVIHRDLKPANMLIDEKCNIKICDFGLARSMVGVLRKRSLRPGEENPSDSVDSMDSEDEFSEEIGDGIVEEEKFLQIPRITASRSLPAVASRPEFLKHSPEKGRKSVARMLTTQHVVTRWYRAPEIILLDSYYGPPVDVWGVGCILAELLTMNRKNAATQYDREPLFPGMCSPSLSQAAMSHPDHHDQLEIIFDVIGTPQHKDFQFIQNPLALSYIKKCRKRDPIDLRQKFPGSSDSVLDLLKKLLVFNPEERLTLNNALEHPFLQDVRDEQKEQDAISGHSINLTFEDEKDIDIPRLRELILQEVECFKEIRDAGLLDIK